MARGACSLVRNPARQASNTPIIKLGPEFARVSDFAMRMGNIPDISDLEHLTVSGDVYFGRNVVVKVRGGHVRTCRLRCWRMSVSVCVSVSE
jgi:UDP-N-acetylglucosamine pyrophosphorylase